jgi:hypothetical protein
MQEKFKKEAERWFACAKDDKEASFVLHKNKKYTQDLFFLVSMCRKIFEGDILFSRRRRMGSFFVFFD